MKQKSHKFDEEPQKLEPSSDAKQRIQRMSDEATVFSQQHNGKLVRYQLNYLNLRARAEPIRLMLHFLRQPYDESLESFEKFAKHKDTFPQPRLPKLIIHGRLELCYTNVILQYLGRKYGLEPDSCELKALAEMLGQRVQEYFDFLRPFINCLLGFVPRQRLDDLREEVLRTCVHKEFGPIFEAQLERNKNGYLVGDSLTWLDFYVAAFTDQIHNFGGDPELFDPFPGIQKHRKALLALPQLEEYLKRRPRTRF